MATKKNKAIFIVKKYPYNHPGELELAPVGSSVDLSHLPIETRAKMVGRGVMEATTERVLLSEFRHEGAVLSERSVHGVMLEDQVVLGLRMLGEALGHLMDKVDDVVVFRVGSR